MLRHLVLILLVVNATFLAWSQGWLKPLIGVQPDAQHEPARLQQQLHADRIVVVGASAPAEAVSAPVSAPTTVASVTASAAPSDAEPAGLCLQAGPFPKEELAQVNAALQGVLPANGWSQEPETLGGTWLVYMGPYPDAELYARKLSEISRIKGLQFEEMKAPAAVAKGLSLGRYESLEAAQGGLAAMKLRGIRTARIVELKPATEVVTVRVPQAAMRTQVALSAVKLPQGKSFIACKS